MSFRRLRRTLLAASLAAVLTILPLIASGVGVAQEATPPGGAEEGASLDDLFLRIAQRFPGFGGLFVDEGRDIAYVYVTFGAPADERLAAAHVRAVLGDRLPQRTVRVRPALYAFAELRAWHDRAAVDVLALPGVVLTDVDEVRNRLRIGVESDEVRDRVEQRLAALGIPRGAVIIEQRAPVRLESNLQDRHRPVVGGLQIAFISEGAIFLCTLGVPVRRTGKRGYLINSHCTETQGGVQDTEIFQPFIGAADKIGVETVDPAYFTGSPCPGGRKCRYSDSAFVKRDAGVAMSRGTIARPAVGELTWDGVKTFQVVSETETPLAGQNVQKVGRTTGRTKGSVDLTCANLNVAGTNITQLCQYGASYNSAGGDSGSPVFRVTNASQHKASIVGLHWGSGGIFSPIGSGNIQRDSEIGPVNSCAVGISC